MNGLIYPVFVSMNANGKILDYNTYCKDKKLEELPKDGSIIAFPRSPKPHQCNEDWIKKLWSLD